MTKSVIGIYETPIETITAIERLTNKGYNENDLSVLTNRKDTDYLESQTDANVNHHSNETLFEKLKQFFTMDDLWKASSKLSQLDVPNDKLDEYTEQLDAGKFLLAVDKKIMEKIGEESIRSDVSTNSNLADSKTNERPIDTETTNQKVYIDAPAKQDDIYFDGSSGDKGNKLP
ncbi:MAG: general stress protein [Bacillus sp. (in: firmicutes)]